MWYIPSCHNSLGDHFSLRSIIAFVHRSMRQWGCSPYGGGCPVAFWHWGATKNKGWRGTWTNRLKTSALDISHLTSVKIFTYISFTVFLDSGCQTPQKTVLIISTKWKRLFLYTLQFGHWTNLGGPWACSDTKNLRLQECLRVWVW